MSHVSEFGLEIKIGQDANYHPNTVFGYGTIHGLMRVDYREGIGTCMVVNSILNDKPGNGHFRDFMGFAAYFCTSRGIHMVFEHTGLWQESGLIPGDSKQFQKWLRKDGFTMIGGSKDMWKPLHKLSGNRKGDNAPPSN